MNILFLTTHINAGGITSYLLTLSKGLVASGHKVFIVSSGGNMKASFESLGVHVFELAIKTKSELSPKIYLAIPKVKTIIKDHHIDILHAHTRVTQVLSRIVSRLCKKPYVGTCHGYFKRRLSRRMFPCWGDKVIAISDAVKAHLIDDFFIPLKRVVLVSSGIDLAAFPLIDGNRRLKNRQIYNIKKDDVVIGIIARLSDVKGQDILIESIPRVVQKYPEIILMIVGEGKMEGALKEQVKKLNVERNIQFISVINKTYEFLTMFDIFVMPSREEGLGLSVMEAQSAGLPVVASRVGGLPSLIEDGVSGSLVERGNVLALADALIALIQDKDKRKKMGQQAHNFIQQKHSLKIMVDETLRVYRDMV